MTGIVAVSLIGMIAWLASSAIGAVGTSSSIGRALSVVFPPLLSMSFGAYTVTWVILLHVLTGVLLAGITALLLRLLLPGAVSVPSPGRRHLTGFVTIWLVLILASHLAGVLSELALLASRWSDGFSTLVNVGVILARPTAWGVVWGWAPALVGTVALMRIGSRRTVGTRTAGAGEAASSRKGNLEIGGLVVVATAAVVVAYPLADQSYARANPALPVSTPPPDPVVHGSAPVSDAVDPNLQGNWCSQDVLLVPGFQDAATGHRSQTISITNTGTAPCVLEGYPDVAFNDGLGNAMGILMVRGGSFLTDDPGPTRMVLDPGASAEAYLGWNAVAGQSEASAGTILLAPHMGAQRQTTPLPLDIVSGQPVTMSAWGPVRTVD